MRAFIFFLVTLFIAKSLYATDSSTVDRRRLVPTISIIGTGYIGAMAGLSLLWYKNEPKSSFHFFNDNHEWHQIDKMGHMCTAFHESRYMTKLLLWSGVKNKKAYFWGGLTGFIMQTPIEFLDGYSAAYGASLGDIAANTLGAGLAMSQFYIWDQVYIYQKYNFRRSPYANLRPNVLGSNFYQELLKDYNGQTYWFTITSALFFREKKFPKWIALSLGYGTEEMIYAFPDDNKAIGLNPYRQYYLSVDIDWERIPTKKKWLKTTFAVLNIFKVPLPTIEFNKNSTKYHWLK